MAIRISTSLIMVLAAVSLAACSLRDVQMSTLQTAQVMATQSTGKEVTADYTPSLPAPTQAEPSPVLEETTVSPQPSATQPVPVEPTPTAAAEYLSFDHIRMMDSDHGWGMNMSGRIFYTQDGGSQWQDVTPGDGTYLWQGFYALDVLHAWLAEASASCDSNQCETTVWYTSDGGQNWQAGQTLCMVGNCGIDYQVPAAFVTPVQLQFVDQLSGWLMVNVQHVMMQDRYRLYATDDGGATWQFVSDTATGPAAYQVTGLAFSDAEYGWMSVNQIGGAEDPALNWYLYYTRDAGKSWKIFNLPTPKVLPEEFAALHYGCGAVRLRVNPPDVMDVDMLCSLTNDDTAQPYRFHFHSINRGQNWVSWQETGEADFVNATWAWRTHADTNGVYLIQRSTDAGAHWVDVSEVPWNGRINFANELNGWVLVKEGAAAGLYHTIDGGVTWKMLHPVVVENSQPPDLGSEPHEIMLSAVTGEILPAVYYPPSSSPAPVVILMHQVNKDLHQWDAIAQWLWKGDVSSFRDESDPWLNSSWFPENTLAEKPAVLVFTYRDCGNGCVRPENRKILNDAQTAIDYVLELPEIDPQRITVIGTSVGADAALDSCFLLQDKTDMNCRNVFSFSPGSYLDYNYISAANILTKKSTNVYCYAARADVIPAELCYNTSKADDYHSFVGKGIQHGIELFSPDYEVNVLEAILQALQE